MEPKAFMIIDDSEVDRFIHRKLLILAGLSSSVSEFVRGQDALNDLQANQAKAEALPDIILLDIMMPEMNGFDFLSHFENLQSRLAKRPLIFMLSSTEDDRDKKRVSETPLVEKLLKKPFSPKAFKRIVKDLEL